MLKLTNIRKDYQVADSKVQALKGISLEFRKNEFVSILGPSGCGKTTTLNIVGGLDKYTDGDLSICGKSTKHFKDVDWDTYRNHRIGFVFQNYNLIPHLTVLGNVELSLTIRGISKAERKQRAKDALIKVGLAEQINKKPNQLSGGQMQRVAIARALVNNPQILLADEPTGALDSETSVQIMELIKEIAKEKLVIMVTHNRDLAVQYSTRIIELLDGEVIADSDPYDSQGKEDVDLAEDYDEQGKELTVKEKKKKRKKTSMSYATALSLSGRNLISKKGRTTITSIAGSIGIIGVCLVLALSSGFNNYIDSTQQEMLSYYPLEISESTFDFSAFTDATSVSTDIDPTRIKDKVYVDSFLMRLANGLTVKNDISQEYLDYVANTDSSYYNAMKYDYGFDFTSNIYTYSSLYDDTDVKYNSFKTLYNYYVYSMQNVQGLTSYYNQISNFSTVFSKMPNNTDFIQSQYDVVAGTFPTNYDEVIMVLDGENQLYDLNLLQLGYYKQTDFMKLNTDPENAENKTTFSYEEIMSHEFYYVHNNEAFATDGDAYKSVPWFDSISNEQGIKLKVVGVMRLKDGVSQGCLSTGLNYTQKFEDKVFETSKNSNIVTSLNSSSVQLNTFDFSKYLPSAAAIVAGTATPEQYAQFANPYSPNTIDKNSNNQRKYGGNDLANYVAIYAKDFDSKDKICSYLDAWNNDATHQDKQVVYTDTMSLVIGIVKTMITAITAVLVAFTSISLVVSSVMIGIITYVSVVERTKEIGVLRAIGARKKDIRNVFNAETAIIGTCSGLIGVGVTYLLSLIANIILVKVTGIAGLCALPIWQAGIMVLISICLTLIAGLIPSSKAARKEPVIALRTE